MSMTVSPPGAADPDDDTQVEILLQHPRFPDAVRLITDRYLALHRDHLVQKVVSDEGRYLVCQFAISLHADHQPDDPATGLTLSRLTKLCLEFKVMSHGRIEATVALLRRSRRLVDGPPGPDRRRRRLLPGPLLEAEFRERVRFHFEALELVMPGRPYLARLRDDPDFYWAVERARGLLVSTVPSLRLRLPALRALAHVEGGYLVTSALIAAAAQGAGLPAPRELSFPHALMARQLGLTRTQLRRVLAALEGYGLLTSIEPGGKLIRLNALAIETMCAWHAIRLLRFDRFGTQACAERDRARLPARQLLAGD